MKWLMLGAGTLFVVCASAYLYFSWEEWQLARGIRVDPRFQPRPFGLPRGR